MKALNPSNNTHPKMITSESHILRRAGRGFTILGTIIVAMVGGSWGYDAFASSRVCAVYPPPGQFVQVGAARMHYVCQGAGQPTVVLVAGIPGGVLDWTPLMPLLAAHYRVCAFDRLGQDYSDPAPHPRTFSTAADELHTAVQELGIVHPVVVGHSFGGAVVQVYAAKYDVAGVVLVDGVTSGVADVVAERLAGNRIWDPLARLGLMRPVVAMMDQNLSYPPATRAAMTALRSRASAWLNVSDEGAVAEQSMASELRAAEPKLDMPLLIIAAGRSNVMNLGVGTFAKSAKELSDRKPNSTYVLFPNSTHYIQAEQPQALEDSIEAWIKTLN